MFKWCPIHPQYLVGLANKWMRLGLRTNNLHPSLLHLHNQLINQSENNSDQLLRLTRLRRLYRALSRLKLSVAQSCQQASSLTQNSLNRWLPLASPSSPNSPTTRLAATPGSPEAARRVQSTKKRSRSKKMPHQF